jgi:hypothetical protein
MTPNVDEWGMLEIDPGFTQPKTHEASTLILYLNLSKILYDKRVII